MGTALVIEDSLTERKIITQYLELAGMKASIASSGEEGLEKLNQAIPDLIVLDVVLPGLSGFEICRVIKAEERTHQIPVIICSTKDTDMDKFWGKRQGADAYIPKPIDQDTFLSTIKQLVP
ncbi:MAG: response regulator [Crocosphaera sp.]|nr:response regulator [Crocosphaera sp.]